jgi:hypothetical protein
MILLLASPPLEAQNVDRLRLFIAGGPTLNDLEVGGMIWIGAVGAELRPVSAPLVVDSSLRYLTYSAADRRHRVLVEASTQWEMRRSAFLSPFLGGGAGLAWRIRPGQTDIDPATHVAAGVRARLAANLAIRLEARLRSLEPLGDFTVGLGWRLGPH